MSTSTIESRVKPHSEDFKKNTRATVDLLAEVKTDRSFRRSDLGRLDVSGLYALFPTDANAKVALAGNWRDNNWPNADRQGVYAFFARELRLLYVGKASQSPLGGRLSKYFRKGRGTRECIIRHKGWSRPPEYVTTIAVPREIPFGGAALEEYLITKLKPCDNSVGKIRGWD